MSHEATRWSDKNIEVYIHIIFSVSCLESLQGFFDVGGLDTGGVVKQEARGTGVIGVKGDIK